jgi:uncharacterized protein
MGALQIDSISVVARSPYLVLWSRLGAYAPAWLDELLAEGALFEYWAHEACLLPIEAFPLFRRRMLDRSWTRWRYAHELMVDEAPAVRALLEHIRSAGPVRSADFARSREGGSWWSWKPEKRMLESLFTAGELMIARREGFQRVYDLRERVYPGWDDARLPEAHEAQEALALGAVRAMGLARQGWLADYFRMPRAEVRAAAARLADRGDLLAVSVEGWKEPAYLDPAHRVAAEAAEAGALRATHTTLLSPFDPVVWDRRRALELFGFDYRLEVYTPAARRVHGYYVLPVLHRGRLVGRVDAKAHRREGVLEVKRLTLERGVRPGGGLARSLARTLHACARWHDTPRVELSVVEPARLLRPLMEAIGAARAADRAFGRERGTSRKPDVPVARTPLHTLERGEVPEPRQETGRCTGSPAS